MIANLELRLTADFDGTSCRLGNFEVDVLACSLTWDSESIATDLLSYKKGSTKLKLNLFASIIAGYVLEKQWGQPQPAANLDSFFNAWQSLHTRWELSNAGLRLLGGTRLKEGIRIDTGQIFENDDYVGRVYDLFRAENGRLQINENVLPYGNVRIFVAPYFAGESLEATKAQLEAICAGIDPVAGEITLSPGERHNSPADHVKLTTELNLAESAVAADLDETPQSPTTASESPLQEESDIASNRNDLQCPQLVDTGRNDTDSPAFDPLGVKTGQSELEVVDPIRIEPPESEGQVCSVQVTSPSDHRKDKDKGIPVTSVGAAATNVLEYSPLSAGLAKPEEVGLQSSLTIRRRRIMAAITASLLILAPILMLNWLGRNKPPREPYSINMELVTPYDSTMLLDHEAFEGLFPAKDILDAPLTCRADWLDAIPGFFSGTRCSLRFFAVNQLN